MTLCPNRSLGNQEVGSLLGGWQGWLVLPGGTMLDSSINTLSHPWLLPASFTLHVRGTYFTFSHFLAALVILQIQVDNK